MQWLTSEQARRAEGAGQTSGRNAGGSIQLEAGLAGTSRLTRSARTASLPTHTPSNTTACSPAPHIAQTILRPSPLPLPCPKQP